MKRSRPARAPAPLAIAVVGLGRVGTACARALPHTDGLTLSVIARLPGSVNVALPRGVSAAVPRCEPGELGPLDGALVCVPRDRVLDVAKQVLSRGIPVVEAAQLHGRAFDAHRESLHHEAVRCRLPVIVGAGWDPGMLAVLRGWLAALVPHGRTQTRARTSTSLHHTVAAREIAGVKDALCTELAGADGRLVRYLYVELEAGAELSHVRAALEADPLLLEEETVVLPVASLETLEDEPRGVVLERWGAAAGIAHQRLLFEARFNEVALTAQVMLAAARALPSLEPGAHTLLDIPQAALLGARIHSDASF